MIDAKLYAMFRDEHGMPDCAIRQMFRWASRLTRFNVRYCNGDFHPLNPNPEDKSRNAELWGKDFDKLNAKFQEELERFGFTVEFNGLSPTLRKDGRDYYPCTD